MPVPKNIQRLVKQNESYENSKAYVADISKASKIASWHEKTLQRSLHHTPVGEYTVGFRDNQLAETQESSAAALATRKERLRALLLEEKKVYQEELASKGLAMLKVN